MHILKKIAVATSFLAALPAMAGAHPSGKDQVGLLEKTLKKYNQFKTCADYAKTLNHRSADFAFMSRQCKQIGNVALPKVKRDGLSFEVASAQGPIDFRFADANGSSIIINNIKLNLAGADAKAIWNQIEGALPRDHASSFMDFFIPRAEAADLQTQIRLIINTIEMLYTIGNDFYSDYHLADGIKACQDLQYNPLFAIGPKNRRQQEQLLLLGKAVADYKSYSDNSTCDKMGGHACDLKNQFDACLAKSQSRISQILPGTMLAEPTQQQEQTPDQDSSSSKGTGEPLSSGFLM